MGLDLKQNLLSKAEKLGIYDKVIQHNANYPLPFDNNKFETVFSNTFYWFNDIYKILKEASRICVNNGRIIILLPDVNFKKNLIYNQYLNGHHQWAKLLDRGIYANISKHCYSLDKWKSIFSSLNLVVEEHTSYLSKKFIQIWNIGMRPYSPYLVEMANRLSVEERKKIKKRLIKEITPILKSYIEYEMRIDKNASCFHMFVLKNEKSG